MIPTPEDLAELVEEPSISPLYRRTIAERISEMRRELRSQEMRLNSQTAALRVSTTAANEAKAAANLATARVGALEGELATMRLALCEIRKAQHDNEAAAATPRANREWMGSQPGNRRALARVSSNLLRAARRSRQTAAKGGQ